MLSSAVKRNLLVLESLRYLNVREVGKNGGQYVETFQKFCDINAGDPWCAAFVHYIVSAVIAQIKIIEGSNYIIDLHKSASCVVTWNKTPSYMRIAKPIEGCIVVWKKKGTMLGHIGIVTQVPSDDYFYTIEGNTSDSLSINRDGDGVFLKKRSMNSYGSMELLGFIDPFIR